MKESHEDRFTRKQDQAFGNMKRYPYPQNQGGKAKRRFKKWSNTGQHWQDRAMCHHGTVAEQLVASLLEDDLPGGAAPDNHRWSHIDREQLAVGTKVEMEHTNNPRVAEEIAADHLTEDPAYYQKLQKAGLADEFKPGGPMPKAKASFYPSAGGPSSM
jgi:hypothetical protein